MFKKNDLSDVKQVLLREEYKSELYICLIRIVIYGFFTVMNLIQATIMNLPLSTEVLPLALATLFSFGILFDTIMIGKRKYYTKYFKQYMKYLYILMDIAILSYLMYTGMNSYLQYDIKIIPQLNPLLIYSLLYTTLTVMFIIINLFRYNPASSIFTGIICLGGFAVNTHLLLQNFSQKKIIVSNMETAVIIILFITTVIITTALSALLSYRFRKVLIISKRQHNLQRFLPETVAAEVLKKGDGFNMDGTRQMVTILFADIRNFTSMSEKNEPEDVLAFLNSYLNDMIEVIFRYQGILDKILGDGIMAIYGPPVLMEDSAENALNTAVDMLKKLESFNELRKLKNEDPISIGIGIHTGYVVMGTVGTEKRMDFTAIGDTVNTASRLQTLTKEYNVPIILSETTQKKLNGREGLTDLGITSIRGREQQMNIFGLS